MIRGGRTFVYDVSFRFIDDMWYRGNHPGWHSIGTVFESKKDAEKFAKDFKDFTNQRNGSQDQIKTRVLTMELISPANFNNWYIANMP